MSELNNFISIVSVNYVLGLLFSFLKGEMVCYAGWSLILLTPLTMLTTLIINLTSTIPPLAEIPNEVLAMLAAVSVVATVIRLWFYAKA
ncbi:MULTISPECIES: hypothetical protein [Enterobacteriaceae]|uniref:hypothetical protein n=1 Tax=Enterobacteriaceae TaxID=543 RepID=UPI00294A35DB|nr:hypothetical protein [Leclercia adecarboxylata]MDV5241822.1 hypothetical protein [Leclercia adecarboxylata]MDV5280121.1 hypothetical protein [Leclercia adecarboxylata]MDV5464032.1 hypothetical protein [Leclercia adecarboxylata]MDV5505863.1 hypothetical protein [Leclercia adecarboxylata]MDV5565328.1 hypothetical protein [Leclercia adecarboxylata]